MAAETKYFPDEYINQIKNKSYRGGVCFSTWQEAHSWLISDREKRLYEAEKAFKNAIATLQRARAMKPPAETKENHD